MPPRAWCRARTGAHTCTTCSPGLGHATDSSRVSVFEMHEDDSGAPVQSCRFDWREDGAFDTLASDSRYRNMRRRRGLGDWAARRRRGEVVQALKRELTGYLLQVFEEHGTLSFISVPIMVDGAWWGFPRSRRVPHGANVERARDRRPQDGGGADRRSDRARQGERTPARQRGALRAGRTRHQRRAVRLGTSRARRPTFPRAFTRCCRSRTVASARP